MKPKNLSAIVAVIVFAGMLVFFSIALQPGMWQPAGTVPIVPVAATLIGTPLASDGIATADLIGTPPTEALYFVEGVDLGVVTTIPDPTLDALIAAQNATQLAGVDLNLFTQQSSWRITPGLDAAWQPSEITRDTAATLYGLIQFPPGTLVDYAQFNALGIDLRHPSPAPNAYLAVIPVKALPELERLIALGRVRYAGPIPTEARISPELHEQLSVDQSRPIPVTFATFAPPNEVREVRDYLYPEYISLDVGGAFSIHGWVDGDDLLRLAASPALIGIDLRDTTFCLEVGFTTTCSTETPPSR